MDLEHIKNKPYLLLFFGASIFLLMAFAVACASSPEPVPRRLGGSSQEIKVTPDWTIKTPNISASNNTSTLEIYIVGDEFYPSFFWIIEKGNWKLDDVERLAALSFLRKKGVDIDSAEIKKEEKIMFVYPQKQNAANHEKNKEDVNTIIVAGE